jgi:nitrite reductase/ring-hydroxylating ferredoxin subunit
MTEETGITRRTAVQTGVAVVAVALTGCRSYGTSSSEKATAPAYGAGGTNAGALANTADIPVGGGKIFEAQKVVVTQPAAGKLLAFSAVCTHAGCTLASVSGGTINCECHGSKFNVTDGSVANGPASQPLSPAKITVTGGKITLG